MSIPEIPSITLLANRAPIIPARLSSGDEVRCIAPARNATLSWIRTVQSIALKRIAKEGFVPSMGECVAIPGPYESSPPTVRLNDLHAAFADPNVKAILSLIGGYNSNQIIRSIDYELITENPKILCGYSDITALTHAIYSQTKLVTYSGPHFFNFGDLQSSDYTVRYFRQCVMHSNQYVIEPSLEWSCDLWAQDQKNRTFHPNTGPAILQAGEAEGVSLGGNLRTFMQLSGTRFWPGLEGVILFIEDTDFVSPQLLDQLLESLISQTDFDGLRALVFGRFHPKSNICPETLRTIISIKKEFLKFPIVMGLDFGHTHPIFTFPIGCTVRLIAENNNVTLSILKH